MPPPTIWPILNVGANLWVFCGPDNSPIGTEQYRTPELAAEAATTLARERGMEAKMIRDKSGRIAGIQVEGREPRLRSERAVALTLEVAPELVRFLDKLAAEMDVDREEVVRLSLGLMRIAQDAKREGNGLAIVTPDLEIDQEIGVD